MTPGRLADFKEAEDQLVVVGAGSWTAGNAEDLEASVAVEPAGYSRVKLDMAGVRVFDTYGAWLLEQLIRGRRQTPIIGSTSSGRHAGERDGEERQPDLGPERRH